MTVRAAAIVNEDHRHQAVEINGILIVVVATVAVEANQIVVVVVVVNQDHQVVAMATQGLVAVEINLNQVVVAVNQVAVVNLTQVEVNQVVAQAVVQPIQIGLDIKRYQIN